MSSQQKLIMLPGPTNVSERVMRAMLGPIINHRGDAFRELYKGILEKERHLFQRPVQRHLAGGDAATRLGNHRATVRR